MKDAVRSIYNNRENFKKPFKVMVLLFCLDALVFFGTFSLNGVFRPDVLFLILYFSFYLYLFITGRKNDVPYLILASLVAFFWTLIANHQYGYNQYMMDIFGLSAFPLFAWACGLAAMYLVFRDIDRLVNGDPSFFRHFLSYSLLYFFFLISLETIAYHVFDIKNTATSHYDGLAICDCIHAPLWMQIAYFVIGPLYFLIAWAYKQAIFRYKNS